MTAVELFFDPVCPFCWMTSRWIEEVSPRVDLTVTYRPISLRMLNPDHDVSEPMGALHQRGQELLRVVQAIAEVHGDDAVGRFYAAVGERIHEVPVDVEEVADFTDVAREQAGRPDDLPALLDRLELSPDLAEATDDTRHDAVIRASTETALARVGEDVGTPIVTFDPPDGPSFFGPILSEVPRGDAAVRLFEATRVLAEHRPFTEFKRSRALPDTAALARLR